MWPNWREWSKCCKIDERDGFFWKQRLYADIEFWYQTHISISSELLFSLDVEIPKYYTNGHSLNQNITKLTKTSRVSPRRLIFLESAQHILPSIGLLNLSDHKLC